MSELDAISIPDKTYFKIGEVAKLLDLEPYVLRYWESEFDVLAPDKTDSGQRIYQRADIELVCHIRSLLYDEMFTIAGARRQLELEREGKPCYANAEVAAEAAGEREQLERLESENDELRQAVEQLNAQLEEHKQADVQPDMWQERVAAQSSQIDELERQLAEARQTIATLEERQSAGGLGVDPRILQGLRQQVEGLARLTQRPV